MTRLALTRLDDRAAPALFAGAGPGDFPVVYALDDAGNTLASRLVFEESFRGGVQVATAGDRVYAAAGPGGGPVLVSLSPDLRTEYGRRFVGDPTSRGGLSLAANPGPGAVGRPTAPGPGFAGRLPVFLDTPRGHPDPDALARRVNELWSPAGVLTATADRPDLPPGDYLTVVVDRMGWGDRLFGRNLAGFAPARLDPGQNRYQPHGVYVDNDLSFEQTAITAAHEIGHALGLDHADDVNNFMFGRGTRPGSVGLSPSQIATARSFVAAFRDGFDLPGDRPDTITH